MKPWWNIEHFLAQTADKIIPENKEDLAYAKHCAGKSHSRTYALWVQDVFRLGRSTMRLSRGLGNFIRVPVVRNADMEP